MKLLYIALLAIGLTSCTENARVKHWGGNSSIEIPNNKKLLNITWKDDGSIWVLYRDMRSDETPETHTFKENSNFGLVEGSITIKETKIK